MEMKYMLKKMLLMHNKFNLLSHKINKQQK